MGRISTCISYIILLSMYINETRTCANMRTSVAALAAVLFLAFPPSAHAQSSRVVEGMRQRACVPLAIPTTSSRNNGRLSKDAVFLDVPTEGRLWVRQRAGMVETVGTRSAKDSELSATSTRGKGTCPNLEKERARTWLHVVLLR